MLWYVLRAVLDNDRFKPNEKKRPLTIIQKITGF